MSAPVLGTCVHLNSLSKKPNFSFPSVFSAKNCYIILMNLNKQSDWILHNNHWEDVTGSRIISAALHVEPPRCKLQEVFGSTRGPPASSHPGFAGLPGSSLSSRDGWWWYAGRHSGRELTAPPQTGATAGTFLLAEELVCLSFLTLPITFHNGQRRHPAPGLHVGFPGFHWLHYFYHHGGVEGFVLRGRQHHHGPGHVWRAVEDVRVSEHRADAV